jgi:nitric oxide reductase NorD protein
MAATHFSPLDKLQIADPDTYVWVKGRLDLISPSPGDEIVSLLADATIWGLSQGGGMGEALAKGFLSLIPKAPEERLEKYITLVRQAAKMGLTVGRIMATSLAPVLMVDDRFLMHFQETLGFMQRKGTYTLAAPLEVLSEILSQGDVDCASVYLGLLATIFSQEITYNQSLRLVYLIPKAVSGFTVGRRKFQIQQLNKVAQTDFKLVDPFLDGLEKGTGLLDENALDDFVNQALIRYAQSPELGIKFLSLSSKVGKDTCAALGRAVPLSQVTAQLNRYLHARMGRSVTVKPLSELVLGKNDVSWVCTDGRHIFLPDEIDCHPTQYENLTLYKSLSRLEAGFFECRTFDFDLEKAADRYPEVVRRVGNVVNETTPESICDGERFVASFFPETLAADLFNIFEQARVALHLRRCYPGLMRQVIPLICLRAQKSGGFDADCLLAPVFAELVLESRISVSEDTDIAVLQGQLTDMFRDEIDESSPVEAMARLVCLGFDLITQKLGPKINRYTPMVFPFDRRLHWDIVGRAFASEQQTALRIKMRLKEMGLEVYPSDLRNRLSQQHGLLAVDDIAELVIARAQGELAQNPPIDLSEMDMASLLRNCEADIMVPRPSNGYAYSYSEWALHLQDYLHDHTRVYEIEVQGDQDEVFYNQTLIQHRGLVANMRRSFELLKPEGLAMLRQWPDGDAFDYRALLDFAMDRRAGRIPSDRLFIKRLKQERDVAVLLLVDLSRSTVNPVSGGHATVLDVTKEALVLFSEALQVVGDAFSIAGFSGTGRHSVDFFRIKGFQESLSDTVRSRISALKAHRSTRMGAAVRHAASLLARTDARVRLLIVVSDGFPNDIGYKSDYAIADTGRAIQEARSQNFHVKAITVNIGSDPRLDDLYGRNHHHVIGDVRELPDKLVRLYGTLTRF